MPDAFSELTLQLSRNVSRLDAERRDRLAAIERAAQAAMRRLPAARAAFERFDAASDKARQTCDRSIQEAISAFAAVDRSATTARSDDLTSVELKYVAAGRTSDDERRAELMKAEAAHKTRLDEIAKTVGLDKQSTAREAAYEAHKKACAAIEVAARERLQKNRDTQQHDRLAAVERERQAMAKGAATRDARVAGAELTRDAAIADAQDALTRALESIPDAMMAQAELQQQRQSVENDYRAAEQKLREEFRARRDAIDNAT